MVDMVVRGLISPHSHQQVPHFGTLTQRPVLNGNLRGNLVLPLRIAALVNILDCMPEEATILSDPPGKCYNMMMTCAQESAHVSFACVSMRQTLT